MLHSTFLLGISIATLSACGGSSSSSKSPELSVSTNEVKTVIIGTGNGSNALDTLTLTGNENLIRDNGITTVQVHAKENSDFSIGITLKDVTSTDENTLALYFLESSVSITTFPQTVIIGNGNASIPIKITGLIGDIECEYSGTLNNIDCNGEALDLSQFEIGEKLHVFAMYQAPDKQSVSYSAPLSIQFN